MAWLERTVGELRLCKYMGWSWGEYLETPADVLRAVELMAEQDAREAEMARAQSHFRR